jgi:hypothetical protein
VNRALRFRATALLLAALFLCGVGGASDLDALLFHGAGAQGAAAPHFEPAGATNHHADNCLLTLRLASSRAAPPLGFAVRFEGIPEHTAASLPMSAPPSFHPGLHQDSRAPPAALA